MFVTSFRSFPGDTFDRSLELREDGLNKTYEETLKDTENIENRSVLCAFCHNAITEMAESISVNGAHKHLFANPHGIVFEIVCFRRCEGCLPIGEPSPEFSWFPGNQWRVAMCRYCHNHLGWLFLSDNSSFYGMILEHLIFPEL